MKATGFHFKYFRNGASKELAVAASPGSPAHFDVEVPTGELDQVTVRRVCGYIIDGATTPAKFGGLTALTNGLRVVVVDADGNDVLDFLDGETIKSNADIGILTGVDAPIIPAAGDDAIPIRWTLSNGVGEPGLELEPGQKLRVTVQDDISDLTFFRLFAQGRR
jgi:hypothetical protein